MRQNSIKCRFCKTFGHVQRGCHKRRAQFEKKGKPLAYVCFESNLTEVPSNTWWIDSGFTVHVSNSMQGSLTIQTLNQMKVPQLWEIESKFQWLLPGHFVYFQTLIVIQICFRLFIFLLFLVIWFLCLNSILKVIPFHFVIEDLVCLKILLLLVPLVYVIVCIN